MKKDTIIVRIFFKAGTKLIYLGRSRIEINKNSTFGQLKNTVAKNLQLQVSTLQLFKDEEYKQKVIAGDLMNLNKSGISDGMILYVSNDKAKTIIAPKPEGKLFKYL